MTCKHKQDFIGSLAFHFISRHTRHGHAQVITHAEKTLAKALDRILSLTIPLAVKQRFTLLNISFGNRPNVLHFSKQTNILILEVLQLQSEQRTITLLPFRWTRVAS